MRRWVELVLDGFEWRAARAGESDVRNPDAEPHRDHRSQPDTDSIRGYAFDYSHHLNDADADLNLDAGCALHDHHHQTSHKFGHLPTRERVMGTYRRRQWKAANAYLLIACLMLTACHRPRAHRDWGPHPPAEQNQFLMATQHTADVKRRKLAALLSRPCAHFVAHQPNVSYKDLRMSLNGVALEKCP